MNRLTIAVVGANGQVGSEVCLLLSLRPDVRVIPIVRSEYGASFLRRCGLECRIGTISDPERATRIVRDADLVADFSLPSGAHSRVKDAIRNNVRGAIGSAPADAAYAFISSTMAFGMATADPAYRHRLVARTPYSSQKRYGERLARVTGFLRGRDVYVLRLGEVHGEPQNASRFMTDSAGLRPVALPSGGTAPSDIVFCSTIALALVNIARRLDPPGTYTVLESPEWTLRQMYEFFARAAGRELRVLPNGATHRQPHLGRKLLNRAFRAATRHKDFFTAQLLPALPMLEQRLRGRYLAGRAAHEIGTGQARGVSTPRHFVGPVPGRRLRTLAGIGNAMPEETMRLREILDKALGPTGHNFRIQRT